MSRLALWSIYSRARAYNCLSFRTTEIYDDMANLHSFSNLTSTILAQLNARLNKEFGALSSDWSSNPTTSSKLALVLDDDNLPSVMQDLRNKRVLELDIDYEFSL